MTGKWCRRGGLCRIHVKLVSDSSAWGESPGVLSDHHTPQYILFSTLFWNRHLCHVAKNTTFLTELLCSCRKEWRCVMSDIANDSTADSTEDRTKDDKAISRANLLDCVLQEEGTSNGNHARAEMVNYTRTGRSMPVDQHVAPALELDFMTLLSSL
ncbi:hypothetical protein K431DRAFT_80359 [Polychaeton citri CBS 116435]|uniref:Uncharacterized protein n=1 Tax=Polychaeton citri CBS 116435 TaxID=1314669 RepID=A0A9P4QG20_9PEZI|nr:hypothetical protein K431DRAFT_80359 [Polychaeton citri CBS 116435]